MLKRLTADYCIEQRHRNVDNSLSPLILNESNNKKIVYTMLAVVEISLRPAAVAMCVLGNIASTSINIPKFYLIFIL